MTRRAALARMEARVVLADIIANMPTMTSMSRAIEMAHNPNVRGYSRMSVTFMVR